MSESIAVVGLGAMGAGATRRLLDQGHRVVVWNRTRDKIEPLIERGAKAAESPGEAAAGAAIVITFLADDRALKEVILGPDGVASGLGQGGVHLSMSTIAPTTARRLAEAQGERGVAYVAAPVFGRPDAAASGQLWIVTSGPAAAKAVARPVLDRLGQGVRDFGEDPAAAHVVKLAGNFLIAAASEAMAEAPPCSLRASIRTTARRSPSTAMSQPASSSSSASRTCAWCSAQRMSARCRCRSRASSTTVSWRLPRRATARWTGPRSASP
jgi:3-hydroxyisobutyrate dehydrogenase-like beta-hydroxyacid dehydrogenase